MSFDVNHLNNFSTPDTKTSRLVADTKKRLSFRLKDRPRKDGNNYQMKLSGQLFKSNKFSGKSNHYYYLFEDHQPSQHKLIVFIHDIKKSDSLACQTSKILLNNGLHRAGIYWFKIELEMRMIELRDEATSQRLFAKKLIPIRLNGSNKKWQTQFNQTLHNLSVNSIDEGKTRQKQVRKTPSQANLPIERTLGRKFQASKRSFLSITNALRHKKSPAITYPEAQSCYKILKLSVITKGLLMPLWNSGTEAIALMTCASM